MNEIDPLGYGATSQATQSPNTNELSQEDFLALMVAQMENQDPFQPMESGEFFSQIAQFGMVAGMEEVQASIDALAGSLVSDQSLAAAGLVGSEVLVPGESITYQGGTVEGAVDVPFPVDDLTVTIYDSAGQPVQTLSLGDQPGGLVGFSWDGMTAEGEPAPAGEYRWEANATVDGNGVALPTLVQGEVTSVTLGGYGQELTLELEGVGEVPFSEVRRIS